MRDAVAEPVIDGRRVFGEALGGVALRPPARVLEHLREIPVIERHPGRDVLGQQRLDQPRVEVDAGVVERAAAVGLQARPGEREAVPADAEVGHVRHVLLVAVVVVVGDVARVAVVDLPGRVRERVPDRLRAPALVDGALDLVARGRGAPGEAVGKAHGAISSQSSSGISQRACSIKRSTSAGVTQPASVAVMRGSRIGNCSGGGRERDAVALAGGVQVLDPGQDPSPAAR